MKKKGIRELGKFALIEEITKHIKLNNSNTLKGIGDDAAVLSFSENTVATTQMLLEGIHFDLMYTPLKHLGYKAVVAAVSDILAMNTFPTHILLSIGVDKRFSVEMIEEFMAGVALACEKNQIDLVGGATTSSLTGFAINTTALGEAKAEELCYRDGAKANDLVCISGDLGAAYLGLQLLEREKALFEKEGVQPDLEGNDYILERQLKPEAQKDMIEILQKHKLHPTAMIDISGGLASDILQICKASKMGCVLYEDKLPIDFTTYNMAEELSLNATTCALHGGEDYELLFTLPLEMHEIVQKIPEIILVGHITEEDKGCHLELRSGEQMPLTAQGWEK